MENVHRPRKALRQPRRDPRRGGRLLGLVFPRRRRDRRGSGTGGRRGPFEHPGRYRLHRGAGEDGGENLDGRRLDRVQRTDSRKTESHRRGPEPYSRRGDDRRGRCPVRRRSEHDQEHRQLARQGNRPHRGDGDRIAQARRRGRGGRRLHPDNAAGGAEGRDDSHLRRSPDGDVVFACRAGRNQGTHRRSGVRGQDLPGVLPRAREYFAAGTGVSAVPVIAIDGPSASGKGTVAQRVAETLGFHHLDSGALYRLVALAAAREGVDAGDEAKLAAIAARLPVRFEGGEIFLEAERVTDAIRTEENSFAASRAAALPAVRRALLDRQQSARKPPGLVAEGRDMGSIVFPDASLKVFLTASLEARAERRYKQLKEKGIAATLAALLQDLRERDARDVTRSVAPLKQSPGARPLDTTSMSAEQAAAQIVDWYRGGTGDIKPSTV